LNNQTTIDTNPRAKVAAAHSRGPTGPHFVVAKTTVGSGIRSKNPVRTKNITALIMNERGSIRVPCISNLSTSQSCCTAATLKSGTLLMHSAVRSRERCRSAANYIKGTKLRALAGVVTLRREATSFLRVGLRAAGDSVLVKTKRERNPSTISTSLAGYCFHRSASEPGVDCFAAAPGVGVVAVVVAASSPRARCRGWGGSGSGMSWNQQ